MKTSVILLLTSDPNLENSLAEALLKPAPLAISPEALQLVGAIDQDLDLAVIDCEHGPHGMTLVSAINSRREGFPVIVVTRDGEKYIEALAYANGATTCLCKPVSATQLADAMRPCRRSQHQLALVA